MILYLQYLGLVGAGSAPVAIFNRFAPDKTWIPWLLFSPAAITAIPFLMYVTACPWWGDFESAYYPAGRAVIDGIRGLYQKNCVDGFVNVPLVAIPFVPLSLLPYADAIKIFTMLGGAAIVAAYFAFIKLLQISGWRSLALACVFVMNGPLFYSIKEGNTSHFFLMMFIGMFLLLERKKDFLVGTLLAISALIKIPFTLLAIYFLLRKRWRVVAGMATTLALATIVSMLIFGLDTHLDWLQKCVTPYAGKPMAAFNVQSLDGFLARLFTDGQVMNWRPLVLDFRFTIVRTTMVGAILLGTLAVFWMAGTPRTTRDEYLEISIIICLLLIIFPISWTHYYLLMILPFGLYLGGKLPIPNGRFWDISMVMAMIMVSLPLLVMQPTDPALLMLANKLLYSHYFLGAFGILTILMIALWQNGKTSTNLPHATDYSSQSDAYAADKMLRSGEPEIELAGSPST